MSPKVNPMASAGTLCIGLPLSFINNFIFKCKNIFHSISSIWDLISRRHFCCYHCPLFQANNFIFNNKIIFHTQIHLFFDINIKVALLLPHKLFFISSHHCQNLNTWTNINSNSVLNTINISPTYLSIHLTLNQHNP